MNASLGTWRLLEYARLVHCAASIILGRRTVVLCGLHDWLVAAMLAIATLLIIAWPIVKAMRNKRSTAKL